MMESSNSAKQQVVLILLGIDKQWVLSKKNGWVDKAKFEKLNNTLSTDLLEMTSKRWWQFWKTAH